MTAARNRVRGWLFSFAPSLIIAVIYGYGVAWWLAPIVFLLSAGVSGIWKIVELLYRWAIAWTDIHQHEPGCPAGQAAQEARA